MVFHKGRSMSCFNRILKSLMMGVVLLSLIAGSLSFPVFSQDKQDFEIHRMTLLSNGDQLNTVPEGMLLERDGRLYIDIAKFSVLFGYKSRVYADSEMILIHQYNHRVLFIANQKWINEVGSFYIKDGAGSHYDPTEIIGLNRELSAETELRNGAYYVLLEDMQTIFPFLYESDLYGTIEVPNLEGVGGYRTSRGEVRDFARIIYYETRDSSMYKKTAVGGVIMNRVNSSAWPNTVRDVIFARHQFPPAYYSEFSTLEPPAVQYEGAVRSLNGENNAPGCFFFNLAPFVGKEADFYKMIEGDYFYH